MRSAHLRVYGMIALLTLTAISQRVLAGGSRPTPIPPPLNPQTVGVNFRADGSTTVGLPGFDGAMGPSQFVFVDNPTIRTYTKAGNPDGALNTTTDAFFAPVLNTTYALDPRVVFDRFTNRWFIVAVSDTDHTRLMIAVSSGPAITSSASFTFTQLSAGTYTSAGPSLGIDSLALYIAVSVYDLTGAGGYLGCRGFVINKSSILSGGPLVDTVFVLGTNLQGLYRPQGVTNFDGGSNEGYFIGTDINANNHLLARRVTDPGGTPSISNLDTISTLPTNNAVAVPQQGGGRTIFEDNHLSSATIKKGSLWACQTIAVNSAGNAYTGNGARDAVRFYEIRNMSGTPTVHQTGTLFDTLVNGPRFYFNGSIGASGQGHVALGCSYAGLVYYAGVALSGRLSSDNAGTAEAPIFFAGSAYYSPLYPGSGPAVWANYSTTSLDPTDDMTFWTTQEYCDSTNRWAVRVTQLKAPPPATPSMASPDSIRRGMSHVDFSLTGTTASGSGFYDPGSGFARRISASVSGSGVTVNSITFIDSTHLTLNVSVDSTAPLGVRTITVTNPDSQSATSLSGILTIAPPPTFSVHIPMQARWNIVSNPVTAANDSTRILFPGANSPAFTYVSGAGYQVAPRMLNGIGCWIRFLAPETTTIQGSTLVFDSIPVSDGWNLIGSISAPVRVSSIASNPPGIITSKFFGYSGSYQTTDTINPGQGYWVKVNGSGWLILTSSGAAGASNRIRIIGTPELPPPVPEEDAHTVVLPGTYRLDEAFPNPFNPSTTIKYELPTDSHVSLTIYNPLGQIVTTLTNEIEPAGYKQAEWNASNFASGIYFYSLEATSISDPGKRFTQVKKMVLIR
jgi:type IX secretion system substrate protein